MRLLIDPQVLTRLTIGSDSDRTAAYWMRLVDWATDRRVGIGEATYGYVYETFARFGYPEQNLEVQPPALRNEFMRALGTILARVVMHCQPAAQTSMDAVYLGHDQASESLRSDASGTCGQDVAAIASESDHWESAPAIIRFSPPPPEELELCTEPGQELRAQVAEACREFYLGKRVHIVGGQRVERDVLATQTATGLPADSITWIPSEKGKPARDISNRWSGLDPDRDVTVCVTGRIGHAQSAAAAAAATRRGCVHLLVETSRDLPDVLRKLARQAGR